MGLAGQKRKNKLSHDPNNTTWAKSTDTFGHKILTSQGWRPGEYLGARDAKHSEHFTAANASHIRVLLREDNLGIGARVGRTNAETFGLSLFSGLLGRLNGKSDDDVQKQASAQRDVELNMYTTRKYGFMNFVSGGLLVGDKMEQGKVEDCKGASRTSEGMAGTKRSADDVADTHDDTQSSKSGRKRKKSRKEEQTSVDADNKVGATTTKGKTRRDKRVTEKGTRRSGDDSQDKTLLSGNDTPTETSRASSQLTVNSRSGVETSSPEPDTKESKRHHREERRARKEERRKRKEAKRAKNTEQLSSVPSTTRNDFQTYEVKTTTTTTTPSNTSSGNSTPLSFSGGRHAVRQRYIQQKRLASMNSQHLNEIFMLKSEA